MVQIDLGKRSNHSKSRRDLQNDGWDFNQGHTLAFLKCIRKFGIFFEILNFDQPILIFFFRKFGLFYFAVFDLF